MNKKKALITIIVLLLLGSLFFLYSLLGKPEVEYQLNGFNEDSASIAVTINSRNIFNRNYYIAVDDKAETDTDTKWTVYSGQSFDLGPGTWYIHVKDDLGHVVNTGSLLDRTLNLDINNDFYPLYPVGQTIELDISQTGIGDFEKPLISSSDERIVSVNGQTLACLSVGTSSITVSSDEVEKTFDITVTDLYTLPEADSSNKPFLKETICTGEENRLLDQVLEMKINEAGYQTRAGVVAAARFLALEFPYKLAYFSESGRLDPASAIKVDGEGRYYHKGLYLSEDKFSEITLSLYGPAYWGQYFMEDTTGDHSKDDFYLYDGFVPSDIGSPLYLMKRPNGLDCSGHVSWCYYNAGFDLGDLGAGGPGSHGMSELGELVMIDEELLKSDRIKAGDLVGFASHIGIVIGVDDEHIWISDNLVSGLKNTCYDRTMESFSQLGEKSWKYFILMDSEYLEDGNYTPMWE